MQEKGGRLLFPSLPEAWKQKSKVVMSIIPSFGLVYMREVRTKSLVNRFVECVCGSFEAPEKNLVTHTHTHAHGAVRGRSDCGC